MVQKKHGIRGESMIVRIESNKLLRDALFGVRCLVKLEENNIPAASSSFMVSDSVR